MTDYCCSVHRNRLMQIFKQRCGPLCRSVSACCRARARAAAPPRRDDDDVDSRTLRPSSDMERFERVVYGNHSVFLLTLKAKLEPLHSCVLIKPK
jgi:hypothetical protein